MLAKDLTVACYAVGFDPMMGFYHQPRFGRPALAFDLMEPFRALVVDSAVLTAVNTGMVTARDFVRAGGAVSDQKQVYLSIVHVGGRVSVCVDGSVF